MEPEVHREYGDIPTLDDVPPDLPARNSRSGGLGRRRRRMVLIVTFIGLASFASPLIKTDSPVLDRGRWSPLEVAIGVHNGSLPVHRELQGSGVELGLDQIFGCAPAYILLLAIAGAALVFPRADLVGVAAVLGALAAAEDGRLRYTDLQDFIYGEPYAFAGHAVYAGALELVLLGVFGLLLWISVTKALDY
jgi:hypothetical protein